MADPSPIDEWNAVAAEVQAEQSPTPVAAVELATQVAPEPTPEPAPVVDPYEGFSPDVRAKLERFDAMSESFPQVVQTLKETQGRVSAMQSDFAKRQALPAAEAPTQREVAQAKQDPEKWASLKKDFPEWGEGIEAYVNSRHEQFAGSGLTAEQIEAQIATRVEAATSTLSGEFQRELIANKYPDWDATVKTAPFETWFAGQTAEVKALAASPKGRDALQMLDLFHTAQKTPAVRTQRKAVLTAAVTVAKGAAPIATKSFADLGPKEQWNYLAEERARAAASA